MSAAYNILCLLSLFFSLTVTPTLSSSATRRILHQPFFPKDSIPPDSSPQSQPKKLPFSSSSSSSPSPTQKAFFPSYHSPPTPPSPTAIATFPANISSLLFPQPSSSNGHPVIAIAVSVSLFSAALVALLVAFIYYRRHRKYTTADKASRSDSLRLYPPNTLTSDGIGSHKTRTTSSTSASTSSEFLYLGTVVNSQEACGRTGMNSSNGGVSMGTCAAPYRKLGSPELKPLPPLPRHRNRGNEEDDDEEEEFFSPRGSSGRRLSPGRTGSGRVLQLEVDKFGIGSRSFNSRTPSYPCSNSASVTSSPCMNLSPRHSLEPQRPMTSSSSPEINWDFPVSEQRKNSEATIEVSVPMKMPPSPPPLPPPRFWEGSADNNEDTRKPKLKPLHWDKVRASSDRAMVWDQLKPSSFQ